MCRGSFSFTCSLSIKTGKEVIDLVKNNKSDPFRAEVRDVIQKEPLDDSYALAMALDTETYPKPFTVSLGETRGVWPKNVPWPDKGDIIVVTSVKRKTRGWRATKARPPEMKEES